MEPEVTKPATAEPIADYAIVEIMGHEKLAGKVSEAIVVGVPMLRVEVPATETLPGFTRMLSGASIFSLTPVPESVARIMAGQLQKTAVSLYLGSTNDREQIRHALGLPAVPRLAANMWDEDDEDGANLEKDDNRPF